MIIDRQELFSLHIPFRIGFAHAQANRLASDSFVLKLTSGDIAGYGEAVVRDYVSGSIGNGDQTAALYSSAERMLSQLSSLDIDAVRTWNKSLNIEDYELPVLCAVETALLDLLCAIHSVDIYNLLALEPRRSILTYGGTVPMLPLKAAAGMLKQYKQVGIEYLRLKLGTDVEYNKQLLSLARDEMGDSYDIRIDANASWPLTAIFEHLDYLGKFGISRVEEPMGRDFHSMRTCAEDPRSDGFSFVADESILTLEDLAVISRDSSFGMLNLRLSKNGGLLRCLDIADSADKKGIEYQVGCLVGETGILSAAGRVAASLMANPIYVDGSYDEHLLSENITEENLSFGVGGKAKIIRDRGLGFRVSQHKLEKLSNEYRACV